jgi:hypothetical protein
MNSKVLIGTFSLILSLAMFAFGVHVFAYSGECTKLFSNVGLICFIGWLPVLIIGIIILVMGISEIKTNNKKP